MVLHKLALSSSQAVDGARRVGLVRAEVELDPPEAEPLLQRVHHLACGHPTCARLPGEREGVSGRSAGVATLGGTARTWICAADGASDSA